MSYEIGRRIMNLEPTERVGRTEYCHFYPSIVKEVTGLDSTDPETRHKALNLFYEFVGYDFLWHADDGPEWEGRWTRMGHAEYDEDGSDFDQRVECPFSDVEEVLEFSAAREYGLPDLDERTRLYQDSYNKISQYYPNLVFPGGYYHTIVSGAIKAFGWEMLLEAQATDPEKFGEDVLGSFFELTHQNIRAWSQTDIEVFVSHDDMVWTSGPIFRPEFYRNYIFPRYRELWKPLKDKGIKVLYCCDGDFTMFIDDIADAGADGFIFEPMTSLEYICEKYGQTHVIVGNADTRILTWGSRDDIRSEVARCMNAGKNCPGFIMAVGNHIPSNVPMENAFYYFDLVNEMGRK